MNTVSYFSIIYVFILMKYKKLKKFISETLKITVCFSINELTYDFQDFMIFKSNLFSIRSKINIL